MGNTYVSLNGTGGKSPMADREPLSGPDNAWRRMGTWDNLMAITGVLTFEERIGYEELCDRFERRLLRFERFGQRIEKRPVGRPYWVSIEDFDVRSRVYHLCLPEPGDKETFESFVASLMSRPLDERQPLWEAYLLENVGDDPGNALVVRLNHSIGDGFALLYVLLGLIDDPGGIEFPVGGVSAPPPPPDEDADRAVEGRRSDDGQQAGDLTDGDLTDGDGESTDDDGDGGNGIPRPGDLVSAARSGAGTAREAMGVAYSLLRAPDEPRTALTGELGMAKRVAWTDRIDLEAVKTIGNDHDATVNVVLLAAIAGALGTYLEGRGENTEDLVMRCTVPVNLKPVAERSRPVGNHFGLAFVELPVGEPDLSERIRFIRERTDPRQLGIEAYLMYLALFTFGNTPAFFQNLVMKMFRGKATGIVTNVPGPLDTIEILGTAVDDIMFWVPQANGQGLGVSILSYDGGVRVGVAADANLVSDPGALTEAFEEEIAILEAEL